MDVNIFLAYSFLFTIFSFYFIGSTAAPLSCLFSSLSYVAGPTHPPLLNETMSTNLRRTVDHYPSNPAIISISQGKQLTYEQFLAEIEATACSLLALGVQRQDRVAVWSSNCAEWTILQHATAMIGAIQVSLNPALREAELTHALNSSSASLIILSPEFKGESQVEVLRNARPLSTRLKTAVVLGGDTPAGWLRWDDLRSAGQGAATRAAMHAREGVLSPGDAVNIQFTSGTTGLPKAATLTHANIVNNGYYIGHLLDYSPRDKVCIPVPLFHCFGQVREEPIVLFILI